MTNTRTIKELLTVMLDNEISFYGGLCGWASNVMSSKLISWNEYTTLERYISSHRPINFRKIFTNSAYYWKRGDIKPRIRWIKRHIKKNS